MPHSSLLTVAPMFTLVAANEAEIKVIDNNKGLSEEETACTS